jgi:hypothetical protein
MTLRANAKGALSTSSVHCENAPSGMELLVAVAAMLRTVHPAAAAAAAASRAKRDLPIPALPASAIPGVASSEIERMMSPISSWRPTIGHCSSTRKC